MTGDIFSMFSSLHRGLWAQAWSSESHQGLGHLLGLGAEVLLRFFQKNPMVVLYGFKLHFLMEIIKTIIIPELP